MAAEQEEYVVYYEEDGAEKEKLETETHTDSNFKEPMPFNVLEDIDTVLLHRVNSFFHSISNQQLEHHRDYDEGENETGMQLANEEQTEFVTGKINFYFHQLKDLLSEQ